MNAIACDEQSPAAAAAAAAAERRTITPAEVAALQAAGKALDLIDVRTSAEFRQVHASGARCIPLDQLDPQAIVQDHQAVGGDAPIYLICKSGSRAAKACARLAAEAGFADAICVEGGTDAWQQAGLPLVTGPKSISLERQVRIAAGLLVLVGIVLGALVNPWLYGISGFVGAGLLFAGISDTCAMGMLLAKCPWNR